MPTTSQNAILMFVRGIPKLPQDSLSVEQGLDSINLLDPNGFMIDSYDQRFPGLKSSAVWADTPITDGRTLMTTALGNISETMRVNLNAATLIQMSALLEKLGKFRAYVNAQWAVGTQDTAEPVYLKHQIIGEPGPRYALLYDIDIDVEAPDNPDEPTRLITVVIEREVYWRWGVSPGDSPKRWTIENVMVGQKWEASKASLVTGNDHLVVSQIDNCQEFLTTTTFQSVNFLDIPADKLPGDAPPLVCITVDSPHGFSTNFLIGVSTNRTSITDRNNSPLPLYNSLAASASSLQSGTAAFTTDNSRGIAHVPVSPNKRTVVVTPAGATEVDICFWTAGANFSHLNPLVLKGKYAVFLRASQIGGTAGAVSARLVLNATQGEFFNSGLITIADDSTAGVGLNHLGTVELPPDPHSSVGLLGKGYTAEYDFSALLSVRRASGAGTVRLVDVQFWPLGSMVYIQPALELSPGWFIFYDDTGYLTHGRNDLPVMGARRFSGNTEFNAMTEGAGQLQLTPGVNNRVYFLDYYTGGLGSQANTDFTPRINIIPRSTGFRTK